MHRLLLVVAVAAVLAGCASSALNSAALLEQPAGTPDAAIRAKFGQPEGVAKHADGTRSLVYSTQPEGTRCFLVRQDAAGALLTVEDTLSEEGRARIVEGMTRQAVGERLCKPIERLVTLHPYEILSWNMEPFGASTPRRFDVYLTEGRVHHTEVRTLYFQAMGR